MKALTIWQPWASLVVAGVKRFETRPWPTRYRGKLAIHAAKQTGRELVRAIGEEAYVELAGIVAECDLPRTRIPDLPRGEVIGTVELWDCSRTHASVFDGVPTIEQGYVYQPFAPLELSLGDFTPGRYAWKLGNPVTFAEPVPARGQQGLWTWKAAP